MPNWSVGIASGALVRTFLPFHWISWKATVVPIKAIGNAGDEEERDGLIKTWKEMVLYQLSNGAILCAVIVGGFSWTMLSSTSPVALTIIESLWFSSLITAVASVAVALHQSVFLARLASVPEFQTLIVDILCYKMSDGRRQPRQEQAFIWLLAVGLLEWSIGLWLGGYIVFLWDITKMRQKDQGSLDIVIASISASVLFISIVLYLFSVIRLWQSVLKSKSLMKIA